jgi:glycosyltransferase involved in cell wall biosynthesis
MTVYQHVVEYNSNDGVGNDITGISEHLDALQINNKIITLKNNFSFTEHKVIEANLSQNLFKNNDVHILHYGISGYPIQIFSNLPGKKILRFHNITPYNFFYEFCSKEFYNNSKDSYLLSYIELQSLCMDVSQIWYDSLYNKQTLREMVNCNFKNIEEQIVPIFKKYPIKLKEDFSINYNLLYTGRMVPHKKIEDLLFLLFYLIKISPNYKLHLVGKFNSAFSIYQNYLLNIISTLNLNSNIIWYNNISETELNKIRDLSGFYLSMSEHEGFCIPILECYGYSIPVIAFCSGAVAETMRMGGIKIFEKNFPMIAELIHFLNNKSDLKRKISLVQSNQLSYYYEKLNLKEYL